MTGLHLCFGNLPLQQHRPQLFPFGIPNSYFCHPNYFTVKPRRRWEDNIGMDLREIGWSGTDWIDLAKGRDQWRALANTVMNLRFP
jgi:hypothetical protein